MEGEAPRGGRGAGKGGSTVPTAGIEDARRAGVRAQLRSEMTNEEGDAYGEAVASSACDAKGSTRVATGVGLVRLAQSVSLYVSRARRVMLT